MALPTSGPISLADIAGEFGGSTPHSISEYYGAGGTPSSGTISFADFYGASAGFPLRFFMIGGGGVGGRGQFNIGRYAGGGGAGGYRDETHTATAGTDLTIVVGNRGTTFLSGDRNGEDSTLAAFWGGQGSGNGFLSRLAGGGGAGGDDGNFYAATNSGNSGGCGGGAGRGGSAGSSGFAGIANAGGAYETMFTDGGADFGGGGGGGCGGPGLATSTYNITNGGPGVSIDITGTSVLYGRGGAGGDLTSNPDFSGAQEPGSGADSGSVSGQPGIVILRWPTSASSITVNTSPGGFTSNITTVGSDSVIQLDVPGDYTLSFS